MAKFDTKMKKDKKPEVKIQTQLVPFERYIAEAITIINNRIDAIDKKLDVIKERITFEEQNKKGK